MECAGTGHDSEFTFMRAFADRATDECLGPCVVHILSSYTVSTMEESFQSEQAHDLLWEGYLPDIEDGMAFRLCVVHWFDLAALIIVRARQFLRADWHSVGHYLLSETCEAAQWDTKEISNLFTWRRVPLT